jgi:hypothetical protein
MSGSTAGPSVIAVSAAALLGAVVITLHWYSAPSVLSDCNQEVMLLEMQHLAQCQHNDHGMRELRSSRASLWGTSAVDNIAFLHSSSTCMLYTWAQFGFALFPVAHFELMGTTAGK